MTKRSRKGRHAPGVRFIMIPRALLTDQRWITLPAPARVIFIDVCKIHHHGGERGPSNNGQIGYGCAAGAKAANVSVTTAYRMLELLHESGLMRRRKKGIYKVKRCEGRTAEWEISIFPSRSRLTQWPDGNRLHIDHWILNSDAYRELANSDRCILIELMRRFDGGNNGEISFGGDDGGFAGFSPDVTQRALIRLERAGFAVQAAPAVPWAKRPRRWRLTMYAAQGMPATKDFMQQPRTAAVDADDPFNSAPNTLGNVSMMRVSAAANLRLARPEAVPKVRITNSSNVFAEETPIADTRASEMICPSDTRTHEIHLDASPVARARAAVPGSAAFSSYSDLTILQLSSNQPALPETVRKVGAATACLFGDALPSVPTPQEQLRNALQDAFRRQRGTQSRVAEALHLSRHTLSNVLAGRERFTSTAAAALRRWLDGEPMLAEWPHLPLAKDEEEADADAAA